MSPAGEQERWARLALAFTVEPGRYRFGRRVTAEGAAAVVSALRAGDASLDPSGAVRTRLATVDVPGLLDQATQAGLRFVCPGEAEWPAGLNDLAVSGPRDEQGEVPVGLWLRGRGDLVALTERSVAVVGSRAATGYGLHAAGETCADLTEQGWTVVSGAAYGIDAAAHRGALAVGGATIAVLACGADGCYPRGNASLIENIASDGVIVSECAPGSPPSRGRFLARNRLIAAMTRGTLVVEAAYRSGALNTANWALDLYRPVMAMPGPITSALSQGCHELVRERDAELVTAAAHVIGAAGAIGEQPPVSGRGPERPWDRLPPDLRDTLDAVPAQVAEPARKIAELLGVSLPECLAALTRLASSGFVEEVPTGWRVGPTVRRAMQAARRGGA